MLSQEGELAPPNFGLAQSSRLSTIHDLRFGGEQEELIRLQDGAITAHLLVQDRKNEAIPLT